MNRLNVTDKTSIHDLQTEFADQQGKLLAKKDAQGNVQLYVSQRSPSLWSRVTGARARQKQLARSSIDAVFLKEGTKHKNEVDGKSQKKFGRDFANLMEPILKYRQGHAFDVGQVHLLAEAATGLESVYSKSDKLGAAKSNQPNASGAERIRRASRAAQRASVSAAEAGQLSDAALNARGRGESKGKAIQQAPGEKVSLTFSDVSGTKCKRDMPNISIRGETFKPTKFLGQGGFADVFEYTSDQGKKYAVKVAKADDARNETQEMLRKEAEVLGKASAGTPKNVLKLVGSCEIDGGQALVMDLAPLGDVFAMAQKIASLKRDKVPSEDQARVLCLTMFKGLAAGLKELHDRGLMHGDFKTPNALLNEADEVVVMDLGAAREGESFKYTETEKVDNPRFKSSDLIEIDARLRAADDLTHEDVKADAETFRAKVASAFPKLGPGAQHKILHNIFAPKIKTIKDKIDDEAGITKAVDIWGLAMSLLNLHTGTEFLPDESFNSRVDDHILAYRKGSGNAMQKAVGGKLPDGALAELTGDNQMDDLLNRCFARNPNDRPEPGAILKDPVLKRPGVGSSEARRLLVAIARLAKDGNDPAKELAEKMSAPEASLAS